MTNQDGDENKIEFIREEEDHYVFSKNGTDLLKNHKLTRIGEKARKGYPGAILKFPLKVGKWWEYEFEKHAHGSIKKRIAKYTVESYEEITVPAGKFLAFKISVSIEKIRGNIQGSAHYWYSPDVKRIIKVNEKKRQSVLKEFKIK
jgi:hypothetical protein